MALAKPVVREAKRAYNGAVSKSRQHLRPLLQQILGSRKQNLFAAAERKWRTNRVHPTAPAQDSQLEFLQIA